MTETHCTVALRFCAGHRLMNHEGECAQLHGHNYTAEVTVAPRGTQLGITVMPAPGLDRVGRVVDFAVIKDKVGGWIDTYWDHGFLLHRDDGHARSALLKFAETSEVPQKIALLHANPTAENMARMLFVQATIELADAGVEVVSVRLWETPTSCAEVVVA